MVDIGSQRGDRRVGEDCRHRDLQFHDGRKPGQHPRRQQRVPAHGEEVVLGANLGHAEHIDPDRGDELFGLGTRGDVR